MAGKDVSKLEGLTLTVKNYTDYLESTDQKLQAEAYRIKGYLQNGYITKSGKTTASYDAAHAERTPTAGGRAAAEVAGAEVKRKKEYEAKAKIRTAENEEVRRKQRANTAAREEGRPIPYPDVKATEGEQVTSARKKQADQYAAQAEGLAARASQSVATGTDVRTSAESIVASTSGVASSVGPTGGTPAAPTPASPGRAKDKTVDKTAWVSFLKQTFNTLDAQGKFGKYANTGKIVTDLIATAKKDNWTETQFLSALEQQSAWWRTEKPSLKQFYLDSTDPRKVGTFQEKVGNKMDAIEVQLEKLGVNVGKIDPITGKVIDPNAYTAALKGVALSAMQNNWDDSQIEEYLAKSVDVVFSGGGTVGTYINNVMSWADAYGVSIDDATKADINKSLLDPNDGRDVQWWYNEMQRQSGDEYAPFAAGLAQGRTMKQMTASYRKTMADLLEVDADAISWKDLMGYAMNDDGKGNKTKATMSDFVKKVKQNPMWQYTRNAKETYTSMGMDLLKEFGIVG